MNLRHIVPALGLVAMTSASAFAADAMPAVSFQGWVDTILTYADDDTDDTGTTAKDEESGSLRFTAVGSLKANWKVTDALSARINLWFSPSDGNIDTGAGTTTANGLNMREAYFAWAINDTVTWSMGKYIDHIGWIAAEPTGLYTINGSLIGYTSTYGNDVLGTSIAVAPKGSPISGSLHITNGYYTASDALNGDPSANRENTDLGFGLDLTYAFPNDMGNVNLDLAYDLHSDTNAGANNLGGDVFLIGLNATVKPVKPLMIGAEVMYQTTDKGETPAGADVGEEIKRTQGLLLANFAFEGAPVPMSVTGMIQYITIDNNAAEEEVDLGVSVALLTNPLSSSNFGLNFEVGFWDISDEGGATGADSDGINVAVEGLVSF